MHALFLRRTGLARFNLHTLSHDNRRVEADAELPDELRGFLLVPREGAEKLRRSRASDGAEVRGGLLASHTNAVVADGNGASLGITFHGDVQIRVVVQKRGLRDG